MPRSQPLHASVLELANRQSGALSRRQVIDAGGTDEQIEARLVADKWQRLHPGVFLTHNGEAARLGQVWSALLYAGPGAAASHETAAEFWGLVDEPHSDVHVTVPVARRVRPQPGIRVHYAHRLPRSRHPVRMPAVTNVEDTVLDLVDTAITPRNAIDWVSRACQRRKTTPNRLGAALAARKKIRWREPILGALADVSDGAETPLELTYLRRVERSHGLPRGTRQRHRKVGARTQWIDVDYGDFRVRVELDGRIGHVDDGAFRDRARDNRSSEDGFVTLRYGWQETYADSCATAAQVALVLGRRGWSGRPSPCNPSCTLG